MPQAAVTLRNQPPARVNLRCPALWPHLRLQRRYLAHRPAQRRWPERPRAISCRRNITIAVITAAAMRSGGVSTVRSFIGLLPFQRDRPASQTALWPAQICSRLEAAGIGATHVQCPGHARSGALVRYRVCPSFAYGAYPGPSPPLALLSRRLVSRARRRPPIAIGHGSNRGRARLSGRRNNPHAGMPMAR